MDESLEILRWSEGGTDVSVNVAIGEGGWVIMSGQDLGEAPLRVFGEDEYEYFVTVAAEHKDLLVLHLVQALFAGNTAPTSAFMRWLEERDIPYEFSNWY